MKNAKIKYLPENMLQMKTHLCILDLRNLTRNNEVRFLNRLILGRRLQVSVI